LLEMMVTAVYFCANETGCHLPQSPVDMLSTGILVLVGLLTLFSLHAWVILEFTRLARISIFRLQILTQELRVAVNKFDDGVYYEKVVKVHAEELVKFLRTWQVTRTFMQRNVNSFFFKSIASQVILLIVCMVCCTVSVLLHLLAPHRFDSVLHIFGILGSPFAAGVTVGLVALWCLGIVYFQACYILKMDTTRLEQLRLLRFLELSLRSTMPPGNKAEENKAIRDASMIALNVASFVRDYVSEHDEPPTLLGVRVDPTFITYLHRSIGVTVAGWVISAITYRVERSLM